MDQAVLKVDTVGKSTLYGELYTELADTDERVSPLQGNNFRMDYVSQTKFPF